MPRIPAMHRMPRSIFLRHLGEAKHGRMAKNVAKMAKDIASMAQKHGKDGPKTWPKQHPPAKSESEFFMCHVRL